MVLAGEMSDPRKATARGLVDLKSILNDFDLGVVELI